MKTTKDKKGVDDLKLSSSLLPVLALGEHDGRPATSSLLLSSFNLQKTKVYFSVTGVLGSLGAKAWVPWCSVCNPDWPGLGVNLLPRLPE